MDFHVFFMALSIFIIGYRTRTVFWIMRLTNGFYSRTIIILFIVCLILFCVLSDIADSLQLHNNSFSMYKNKNLVKHFFVSLFVILPNMFWFVTVYCYICVLHSSFFRSRFQILSSFCIYIFHSHPFSTCTFSNTSIYMICNNGSLINVYNGLIESQLFTLPLCKAVECIYRLVDIYLYHLIVVFTGALMFGLPVFTPEYKIPRSFTIDLFYTRLTIIGFFSSTLQKCTSRSSAFVLF